MKRKSSAPHAIHSVSELHRLLQLPQPDHPLVSVIDLRDISCFDTEEMPSVAYGFYSVCIKKDFNGKLKYGQRYYDFDAGVMTFFAPGQVVRTEPGVDPSLSGWWLIFHPDLIRRYALDERMKGYGFFSYEVAEALHLSAKEEAMVTAIVEAIRQECRTTIDGFSQDVIVSQIELLLTYSNRFYNRQFITRHSATNDVLVRMDALLSAYFDSADTTGAGLPTVHYLSRQLNLSPSYLSDMLRSLTGQNAQQHIHAKLMEKAKDILATTSLSVSEIAYRLGFEHPQSFSKLFKAKAQLTPLAYRQSFN